MRRSSRHGICLRHHLLYFTNQNPADHAIHILSLFLLSPLSFRTVTAILITQVFPSKDSKVRTVEIRVARPEETKLFLRPITLKLAKLLLNQTLVQPLLLQPSVIKCSTDRAVSNPAEETHHCALAFYSFIFAPVASF